MTPQLSPVHPASPLREIDLQDFASLVPPSGGALLRLLGIKAGLSLINGLGGVQVTVPKGPYNNAGGARVWQYISAVIGESARCVLSDEMGGSCLEVPTCDTLRKERRNQAIRARFDHLTARSPAGEGLSKARAVQELCLIHAPITWRQLEIILDRPTHVQAAQNTLFSDLFF